MLTVATLVVALSERGETVPPPQLAFQLVHGHQQLRGGALLPGFHGEGVGDGVADAIRVANVQAEAGAFDGGAGDVEGEERSGEVD